MTLKRSSSQPNSGRLRRNSATSAIQTPDADRASQLADIAASGNDDNSECAAADLFHEFPPLP
jgi:hypothetical protein